MLNIFTLANGRLFQEEIESLEELSRFQPIWVDLESPTLEEKRWIKQYYGLSIPEDVMDEDIEESARFYEEDNGELHIRSDFLIADDEEPRTVRVAFILNLVNDNLKSKGVLFSIHDEDVPVFRLLRMRARRAPGLIEDAKEVLLKLFDADAEYSADTLEGIYIDLEKVSTKVLSGDVTDVMAGEVLGDAAFERSVVDQQRRAFVGHDRAVVGRDELVELSLGDHRPVVVRHVLGEGHEVGRADRTNLLDHAQNPSGKIRVDAMHQLRLVIEGIEMPFNSKKPSREPEEPVNRKPEHDIAILLFLCPPSPHFLVNRP